MACIETRPTQHSSTHLLSDHSDPKLDAAVKQLLHNYMAPLPSQRPPLQQHHQYHHRRNQSVDFRQQHRHHSPKRTSTSWLSNNAGFETEHFHARPHIPTRRNSTPVQNTMTEMSPKPRRYVTFEDEASRMIRTVAVSPEPISNAEERNPPVSDSKEPSKPQQRPKGFKALFHFEKPKLLVKRATL